MVKTDDGAGRAYESDEEVEEVLRRVESCALVPDEFRHREHLVVALLYLLRPAGLDAHERLRESILRLLRHHQLDERIYHETITVFWLRRVRAFADVADLSRPVHELANELAERCADSRLIFDYYSKEVVDSEEARAGWVEPDLKPLDF